MSETSPSLIQQFYKKIDELVIPYFEEYRPYLQCKKGCTECCTDETGFEIRQIEANEIIRAFDTLSKEEQAIITEKIRQAKITQTLDTMPCPMLIESACSIYSARPIICRVFGLLIELRGQKGCCKLNFNDVPAEVNLNTIGLDDAYDLLNELNSTVDKKDLRQKISHWLCDTILGSSV